MTEGYCDWVDTVGRIASFHAVEQSDLLRFDHYESFMSYLASLTTQGYRFQ